MGQESPSCTFSQRISELKEIRKKKINEKQGKSLSLIILGAGPAGLIHAIVALLNGQQPIVLEKRPQDCSGRPYAVMLKDRSIEILQEYGALAYLQENGLIMLSQNDKYCIALVDLERALKAVISELEQTPTIKHHTYVVEIIEHPHSKIELVTVEQNGIQGAFSEVDLVVNAEGSHSQTNDLLRNRRIEFLPRIPAVSVVFENNLSSAQGAFSLSQQIFVKLRNGVMSLYCYGTFACRFLFSGVFLNPKHHIAALHILKIGRRYLLGYCLSSKASKKLTAIDDPNEFQAFTKQWAYFVLCYSSVKSLLHFVFSRGRTPLNLFGWRPIKTCRVVKIGSDRVEHCSFCLGRSLILVIGDALVTADPSTELGCQTALESSLYFGAFLQRFQEAILNAQFPKLMIELQQEYDKYWEPIIAYLIAESVRKRKHYNDEAPLILGLTI